MELTIGESMKTRTNSLGIYINSINYIYKLLLQIIHKNYYYCLDKINELGPPDLCYILKSNNKINATVNIYIYYSLYIYI